MRKNLVAVSIILCLLLSYSTSFATDNESGALLDDPNLTISEKIENKKIADEKDNLIKEWENKKNDEISIMANPDGEWYGISLSNYRQERDYLCGPAALRQSLSFHKYKSGSSVALPSQYKLAVDTKTEVHHAAITTNLRNTINSYKYTYGFSSNPYGVANIYGYSNPTATFESRIKYVLSKKINAPIVLMRTSYLPRYNGKSIRHYNTISAYSHEYATGSKSIRTVDPHYSNTYYGVHWDSMGSTTRNGVVRAVYKADVEGSNYVMLY